MRTWLGTLLLASACSASATPSTTTSENTAVEPAKPPAPAPALNELHVDGERVAIAQALAWVTYDDEEGWGTMHAVLIENAAEEWSCGMTLAAGPPAGFAMELEGSIEDADPVAIPGWGGASLAWGRPAIADGTARVEVVARAGDRWTLAVEVGSDQNAAPSTVGRVEVRWCGDASGA
jgi:hypothetical protein